MDIEKFRKAFQSQVELENTWENQNPYAIAFQTAMEHVGRAHQKVEVITSRRGPGFRITVEVPVWAQRHLAEFVDAEIQAEQDRAEQRAAARRLQP